MSQLRLTPRTEREALQRRSATFAHIASNFANVNANTSTPRPIASGELYSSGRWLTPSREVGLDVVQFDFRVGGMYRFAYRVPGRNTMVVSGVYRVIEPPSRIVFSWDIEPPDEHAGVRSEVTVTLTLHGTGTDLQIRHAQLRAPGAPERHAAGWSGAVDHLVAMLTETDESTSRTGGH
jgi:uncharacterized protein YndB with AHSA1/START domain